MQNLIGVLICLLSLSVQQSLLLADLQKAAVGMLGVIEVIGEMTAHLLLTLGNLLWGGGGVAM
jgi:hypothetical protein